MAQTQQTAIYVGDLPVQAKEGGAGPETQVTDEFLRSLFSDVGKVVEGPGSITIKTKEDKNGNPHAYAYVVFETREDAEKVIQKLNYTKLGNFTIRLSLADPETERIRKSRQGLLFIQPLDPTIEVSQLHEAFANFGDVISCKIPSDNGVSRGYGYVQFRNPADAEQAMNDLKDASMNNRPVRIELYCRMQRQNPEETFQKLTNEV